MTFRPTGEWRTVGMTPAKCPSATCASGGFSRSERALPGTSIPTDLIFTYTQQHLSTPNIITSSHSELSELSELLHLDRIKL